MMDGYSVQDAASVLGVPEGRVWELLARGVLAGSPDGDSMRVFLKSDAAQVTHAAPPEALPRGNGNGGTHGEASAFRELLTEFRNLTERYGQALLALGEARGEVAGLRSRVELLEARLDLRLPAAMDAAPISWEAPAPVAPAPEPPAPADIEAVIPAPAPVPRTPRTPRPRKARTTRAAVAGFAEALARAQDPNPAEVGEAPVSEEVAGEASAAEASAAEPSAADEPAVEGPAVETSQAPGVVPDVAVQAEAEEIVVADRQAAQPPEPTYTAAMVEPDWFADGDFSWLDAAELEARSQPEVIEAAPAATTPEVEAAEQAPPAIELEPEPAIASRVEPEPEAVVAVMPEPEAVVALMPDPEPVVATAPEPEPEPEPVVAAAPEPEPVITAASETAAFGDMQPVEVGSAGEEAVMWLGGPPVATHAPGATEEIQVASAASLPEGPAPRTWDPRGPAAWPDTDRGTAVAEAVAPPLGEAVAPPLAMTEQELAQLARDEGWDDTEVALIRAMISRPALRTVDLPGARELDEAMSALQAVPIESDSEAASGRQWAKPATPEEERSGYEDWAFEVEPAPSPTRAPLPPLAPNPAAPDPDWLRRRRGPAATAYRRIRRIFTG